MIRRLSNLRVVDLRSIASDLMIDGRSKARTKEELVDLIIDNTSRRSLSNVLDNYDRSMSNMLNNYDRSMSPSSANNKYILQRSTNSKKKWMVTTPSGKKVHFGQKGASDYTKHKDDERKQRYIVRHGGTKTGKTSTKEKWGKDGLSTPGFWSRWLTWNKKTLEASIKDIERKFGINITKRR